MRYIHSQLIKIYDDLFFRDIELQKCKTEKERNILKDRWSREDSTEKIANAIRSIRY